MKAALDRSTKPATARTTEREPKHPIVRRQKPPLIGIELFAGAGGLSHGATAAGIDVKVAVELDEWAAVTYHHNHPQTIVVQADLRTVQSLLIPGANDERIIFGGPPCQGFSTSNQRTRDTKNTNNWLFEYYAKLVAKMLPEWVVFENVEGIVHTEGGFFLSRIKSRLEALGYVLTEGILNAMDFGVPQNRSRFFLVGRRGKSPPPLPSPSAPRQKVTVSEAISDLPKLKSGANINSLPYRCSATSEYARKMRAGAATSTNNLVSQNAPAIIERYRHIPQGGNWENIPAKLMKSYSDRTRCHTGIYRRLSGDEPSVVIGNFRKNMLIHPTQNRGLSVREAARLQSFPDSYQFFGTIGFQQQQVGNAVPPLLANAVFDQIVSAHYNTKLGETA